MSQSPDTSNHDSFLASYSLPNMSYEPSSSSVDGPNSLWEALTKGEYQKAVRFGREALRCYRNDEETRAAILAGMAAAEWKRDKKDIALVHARASLEAHAAQWLAPRILLEIWTSKQDHESVVEFASQFDLPQDTPDWDYPLPIEAYHLIIATSSWQLKDWEATARHLSLAFPGGIGSMPTSLQEDWFRLAVYREQPDDAGKVAMTLIADRAIEYADKLIQTLVTQGWNRQALTLYRFIFNRDPENELLRRRLVGLCIREGEVDEARKLMEQGALRMVV